MHPQAHSKKDQHKALKFALLLLLLLGYFGYLSWKFDLATGGLVAGLTWSFFVLCTPIADAGFLLDFPLRLLFGIRMLVSEIFVWIIAISLNSYAMAYSHDAYQKTILTQILEKILATPWPYWSIIALSCAGTFLSVHFGDKVMDNIQNDDEHKKHRDKHLKIKLALYAAFFALAFIGYKEVATSLDIDKIIEGSDS